MSGQPELAEYISFSQAFSSNIEQIEYPAPKEQIIPFWPFFNWLYLWKAIIDPAELVFAYSSRTIGARSEAKSSPNNFLIT